MGITEENTKLTRRNTDLHQLKIKHEEDIKILEKTLELAQPTDRWWDSWDTHYSAPVNGVSKRDVREAVMPARGSGRRSASPEPERYQGPREPVRERRRDHDNYNMGYRRHGR